MMKSYYLGQGEYTDDKEQGQDFILILTVSFNICLISFRTIPGLVDMLTDAKLASPLHQVPKMRKPAEMMIIIMIQRGSS